MKITIKANSGDFSFECGAGERMLYAGLTQGFALPYECATGTCGTCRGRLLEGAALVEWDAAPGFARLKREKGDVLMCQARPTQDCVLRVPANIASLGQRAPLHRVGRIVRAERLNREVIDFDLLLSEPMTFQAGQFVVLETPALKGGRAYSMVNFVRETDRLTFVIKRKIGGGFCDWLFETDLPGNSLNVFGPLGGAVFRPEENRDIICVAGGSGIAGMLAILEHARAENYFRDHAGEVFFGVRSLADGFYLDQLSNFVAAAEGKLRVTLALSEEAAREPRHPCYPNIQLATGLVVQVMAREMAGRFDGTVSFIAGPTPMVEDALRVLIRDARQPAQFVRYDKYT